MNHLAILFGRYRAILAVFVIAFTGLSLYGISRLTFDNDPHVLFKSKKADLRMLDEDFVHLESTCVVVVELDDSVLGTLITPQALGTIREMVGKAAQVEGIEGVYSMLDVRGDRRVGGYLLPLLPSSRASQERFEQARDEAAGHPLLVGHFLSPDMRTSLLILQLEAGVTEIDQFKSILGELRKVLDGSTAVTGLQTRITGTPPLMLEIVENMRRDIFKLSSLGATLVLLIAACVFRRVGAVLMVAIPPAIGTIWTMGVFGLIGQPINMLTNIVPVLVLVIGFTDSVHLVLHVRRSLAGGASGVEAAQDGIRRLGLPCALTSLSTAVGFGSLVVADLGGIQIFGRSCALGTLLSFCAVLTVLPLLASTRLSRYAVPAGGLSKRHLLTGCSDRLIAGIIARPRTIVACGGVLMLFFGMLVTRLEPNHTISTEIPHSSEVYRALEHIDEVFGGVMFAYAIVQWPEESGLQSDEFYQVLDEVHGAFDADRVLRNPLSMLNLVGSLPGADKSLSQRAAGLRYIPDSAIGRFANPAQRRAVVSAHMPDAGARVLNPAFKEVESRFLEIERRHPGYRVELAGASVAVFKNIHLMIADLWKSLTTAACVMFLMIWIGMRSMRYALISIIPNAFPLLATASFIVLTGRYLEMTSVIVFSISLGIAVDDTIHFMVRFQQEMRVDNDPRLAVRRSFKLVGAALVITTMALVAGHGIVMLSGFPAIRIFGLMTCVTLASALIGDLLILPALLVWMAKRRR